MSAHKKGIVRSAKAEADVNDILLFTWQRWGEEQRDRYEAAPDRAIATPGDFPKVGSSVSRLIPGCRARHVERHILYYRILDDRIEVVRILHERTDPTRHFQS